MWFFNIIRLTCLSVKKVLTLPFRVQLNYFCIATNNLNYIFLPEKMTNSYEFLYFNKKIFYNNSVQIQRDWNPTFLFLFHPLYTLFTKTNIPTLLQIMFFNMIQIYTTPLNTTIFLTSKSYGGIKLLWIWRISTWLKLFK